MALVPPLARVVDNTTGLIFDKEFIHDITTPSVNAGGLHQDEFRKVSAIVSGGDPPPDDPDDWDDVPPTELPDPVSESAWKDLVCLGGKLFSAMSSTDEVAGQLFGLQSAASTFKDFPSKLLIPIVRSLMLIFCKHSGQTRVIAFFRPPTSQNPIWTWNRE